MSVNHDKSPYSYSYKTHQIVINSVKSNHQYYRNFNKIQIVTQEIPRSTTQPNSKDAQIFVLKGFYSIEMFQLQQISYLKTEQHNNRNNNNKWLP